MSKKFLTIRVRSRQDACGKIGSGKVGYRNGLDYEVSCQHFVKPRLVIWVILNLAGFQNLPGLLLFYEILLRFSAIH